MSENVKKYIEMHHGSTVIIWAANLHIGKRGVMGNRWTKDGVKSKAEYLEKDLKLDHIAIDTKKKKKSSKICGFKIFAI